MTSYERTKAMLASVVIPAYRSKDTIESCLGSLVVQETDMPFEVIVVESSGDGAGEIIRRKFPEVQLIEPGQRTYAGAARNLGAERARGDLLLFLDSDCTAETQWLEKMRRAHEEWDCSAVAGSILNANPETTASIASYVNEHSDFYPHGEPRYVDYLCSGNVCYKIDVFRKHDGFDSAEPLYEDVMFNRRLHKSGEKLLFVPDITIKHHHRTSISEYLSHEFRRGKAAAVARRRGLMPGSFLAKYPALALLATPALFMLKMTAYPRRFIKAFPSEIDTLVRALPCLSVGVTAWHYGFLREILNGRARG